MAQFKKKHRWKQRQRHSGGRWPQYQAPAWWVCVMWVNTALVWDVVFDKGVAPQQKMLTSQHDCDGSKSLGRWGNLLWHCSGLWRHVTSLSHKSAAVTPFSCWGKKHTALITVTRSSQLLPLPRQTSAKWQPLSPGSLQNSTTSRHVVSGVMGTSVTACSPSLRYTVNIIWEIRIQSWGLKE